MNGRATVNCITLLPPPRGVYLTESGTLKGMEIMPEDGHDNGGEVGYLPSGGGPDPGSEANPVEVVVQNSGLLHVDAGDEEIWEAMTLSAAEEEEEPPTAREGSAEGDGKIPAANEETPPIDGDGPADDTDESHGLSALITNAR